MIKILRERMQFLLVITLWVVIIAFVGTIFLVWGRGLSIQLAPMS